MAANYVLLEKITVGAAGVASVTFNSIPQTGYTDLKLVCSNRNTTASTQDFKLNFNGVTTNLSQKYLLGAGSGTPSSGSQSYAQIGISPGTSYTANTFASTEIYIPNYTSSNYKSFSSEDVTENNGTTSYVWLSANLWSSTAAITSITLSPNSNNFAQYSTFYLYGLAAVGATPTIAPYATGGDIVQTDGTYWYHAFLSSGSFTPKKALSCDVLVVAGGGGGGTSLAASYNAGGGGAGGLLFQSSQSLATSVAQTVTIGAGGATNASGGSSSFGSISGTIPGGGGGGGNAGSSNGLSGGSGGGGNSNGTGGSSTASGGVLGNAGGAGANSGPGYYGGGGGGAGGAGTVGGANPSPGGAGYTSTIIGQMATATSTGVSNYFAGGGGGGGNSTQAAGGSGGGGAGGYPSTYYNGVIGTPNTGSGGGGGQASPSGGGYSGVGGNGGSGIVIVRYAI